MKPCADKDHSPLPSSSSVSWQWCRICGSIRHPDGHWEAPVGTAVPTELQPVNDPAIAITVSTLTAHAERDAQLDKIQRFARFAVPRSASDAEKIDTIKRNFARLMTGRREPGAVELVATSAERVLFSPAHVDADEAAVALAALLKATGVQVRLWAGRKGNQGITLVVDAYDAKTDSWIPIDPMGGIT